MRVGFDAIGICHPHRRAASGGNTPQIGFERQHVGAGAQARGVKDRRAIGGPGDGIVRNLIAVTLGQLHRRGIERGDEHLIGARRHIAGAIVAILKAVDHLGRRCPGRAVGLGRHTGDGGGECFDAGDKGDALAIGRPGKATRADFAAGHHAAGAGGHVHHPQLRLAEERRDIGELPAIGRPFGAAGLGGGGNKNALIDGLAVDRRQPQFAGAGIGGDIERCLGENDAVAIGRDLGIGDHRQPVQIGGLERGGGKHRARADQQSEKQRLHANIPRRPTPALLTRIGEKPNRRIG